MALWEYLKKELSGFKESYIELCKNIWMLFRENTKNVALFILVCSIFSFVATYHLKEFTVQAILNVRGATYVGPDNLLDLLLDPVSLLILFIFLVVTTHIAMFQIGGLLHGFAMTQIGRETNFTTMVANGLRVCMKSYHPKNWLAILYIMLLLPLTNLIQISNDTFRIIIPAFIHDFIVNDPVYSVIYYIVVLLLFLGMLLWIFALNVFVLEDNGFIDSCKKSKRLGKGRYLTTLLSIVLLTMLTHLVIRTIASSLIVNLDSLYYYVTRQSHAIVSRSVMLGSYIYAADNFFLGILLPAITNAGLTVLYFRYLEENEELEHLSPEAFKVYTPKMYEVLIPRALFVAVISYSMFQTSILYSFLNDKVDKPTVVAHRGDSINAPENTLPAFELALQEQPDWVELDVHQTKDGVIIVSHDDDLTRVAQKKVFVHELTYRETQKLEVGSWFSELYKGTKLSTLDEILKLYKDSGIKIQVEIKPSGYDKDLEKNVLEVIHNNDMQDQCVITCLNKEPLEKVKKLDPDMITVYSMFVAMEDIEDIDYVDWFTIEERNITAKLVHNAHKKDKKVFAWTVNSEERIQYLVSCGVDGILTDNPMMMSEALLHVDYSGGVARRFYLGLDTIANTQQ